MTAQTINDQTRSKQKSTKTKPKNPQNNKTHPKPHSIHLEIHKTQNNPNNQKQLFNSPAR
jgi:hypothetical protein